MSIWTDWRGVVIAIGLGYLAARGAASFAFDKESDYFWPDGCYEHSVVRVDDMFNITELTRYECGDIVSDKVTRDKFLLLGSGITYTDGNYTGGYGAEPNDGLVDRVVIMPGPLNWGRMLRYDRTDDFRNHSEMFLEGDRLLAEVKEDLEEHFDF